MQKDNENRAESLPNLSEGFGSVRNDSESFRNVRNDSEGFRSVPNHSERNENHTLTVRDVARMFEAAGVARTERSIVNWCQSNSQGVARLDAYFDPNERKYFITPQSVNLAIAEEQARATKRNTVPESVDGGQTDSETPPVSDGEDSPAATSRIRELEREVTDLKITNRGKDLFIEQLRTERSGILDQLLTASRKVGELETKLLQLEEPKN